MSLNISGLLLPRYDNLIMRIRISGINNAAPSLLTSLNRAIKLFLFTLLLPLCSFAKDYTLISPDKNNSVKITIGQSISWSVFRNKETLIKQSPMSLTLGNGKKLGNNPIVIKSHLKSVNQTITAIIPVRNKIIPEIFNELKLEMKDGYTIEFRAYNDGVAYRFVTALGDQSVEIKNEEVVFNFTENCQIYLPKESDPEFQSHYEGAFNSMKVEEINPKQYGYLPLYVATNAGTKMVITESDLKDYPNLFLFGTGGKSLIGNFPKSVLETKPTGNIHLDDIIVKKADYHAKTSGNRTYPWRVVMISPTDKGLLETELVYKLAKPNVLKETAWIKPGKIAWDWWNDNSIYGVNFKAGINTETYKYFIDFASEYGLQYIILDEGWSKSTTNFIEAKPELDVQEILKYGKSKNVGIILWILWKPMDQDMDAILDKYAQWGVKGVKVDFMARADQYVVNFYEKMAKAAAKRKLLVDFHGAFKPVGLNREYPNVLNYEGVKGLEQSKWDTLISPVHDTTIPFIRMAAGPMDYTPGAMLNSNKGDFHISYNTPMSMGTRAHQAAMYVIYDAPLQMLCDNPTNYRREPVYIKYISRFPTTWDKTVALEGKIGAFAVVARKNGNNWYIGGMTNWDARKFNIPLNFLDGKKYKIEILKDGINVGKQASDYQIISKEVNKGEMLTVDMSSGGGYTAILTPLP